MAPLTARDEEKRNAARETIDILHEISTLLVSHERLSAITHRKTGGGLTQEQNTGLDRQSLSYCVSLIENGINPEALAVRVTHLTVTETITDRLRRS